MVKHDQQNAIALGYINPLYPRSMNASCRVCRGGVLHLTYCVEECYIIELIDGAHAKTAMGFSDNADAVFLLVAPNVEATRMMVVRQVGEHHFSVRQILKTFLQALTHTFAVGIQNDQIVLVKTFLPFIPFLFRL